MEDRVTENDITNARFFSVTIYFLLNGIDSSETSVPLLKAAASKIEDEIQLHGSARLPLENGRTMIFAPGSITRAVMSPL